MFVSATCAGLGVLISNGRLHQAPFHQVEDIINSALYSIKIQKHIFGSVKKRVTQQTYKIGSEIEYGKVLHELYNVKYVQSAGLTVAGGGI